MRYPALLLAAGSALAALAPSAAQASAPKATLSLHPVVTGRTVPGTEPLPAAPNRVELPPAFTLAVNAPAGAASAAFFVNGQPVRVDNQPPFFLTDDATHELIDALKQEFSVDPRRVYLTGVSMGGFGTWEFAARRPELFAAAAPMFELLKKAGADVRSMEYPETRHGPRFRKAWAETELLPWIFSQRRE